MATDLSDLAIQQQRRRQQRQQRRNREQSRQPWQGILRLAIILGSKQCLLQAASEFPLGIRLQDILPVSSRCPARLHQARLPMVPRIRSNEVGSEKVLGTGAAGAATEIVIEIEIGAETKIATATRTRKKKKLRSRRSPSANKLHAFQCSSPCHTGRILAMGILRQACPLCSLTAHRQELHRLQRHLLRRLRPPQAKGRTLPGGVWRMVWTACSIKFDRSLLLTQLQGATLAWKCWMFAASDSQTLGLPNCLT